MIQIEALPDDLPLTMVENGTEDGRTWTRLTDGEKDYLVFFNPETRVEECFCI